MPATTYELWYTDDHDNAEWMGNYSTEENAWEAAKEDGRITDYSFYQVIRRYV